MVSAHGNLYTHHLPRPDTESTITACGLDIDGQCDRHRGTPEHCRHGLAWTRGTDLAAYQRRPYDKWPPPCLKCQKYIDEHAAEPSTMKA